LDDARGTAEGPVGGPQVDAVFHQALEKVPGKAVRFTGYEKNQDVSKVVCLIQGSELVDSVAAGDEVLVVTEATPFYGEAGGQVGDHGTLTTAAGARLVVSDTTKPVSGIIVHHATVEVGSLGVGEGVTLAIDVERRERIRRNHSATHLLHLALRRVLGPQAQQKGSLVGPDRFRFDFTHNSPLTPEQIAAIERMVNEAILRNDPV